MGDLTTSIVLATTSFLLGTLAMHWTADHLLLWQAPITHDSLLSAHQYYANSLAQMPTHFVWFLFAVGTVGASTTILKAAGGRESNWLFDGASLFLYGAAGMVYQQKIRPSVNLLPALAPVPLANPDDPRDSLLGPLRELASSNAVVAVALLGIIILQSGQYYSERLEERERVEEDEARVRRRRRRALREERSRSEATSTSGAPSETTTAANSSPSSPRLPSSP